MNDKDQARFDHLYEQHVNALILQGKSKKTQEMYARSLRKICAQFDMPPDRLTVEHYKTYFLALVDSHSWSSVKIDRNAFQFFLAHVLEKEWEWFKIVKPPKVQTLQDVLAPSELSLIINATRKLSYQTYFLTTYSLGLCLTEALRLKIAEKGQALLYV